MGGTGYLYLLFPIASFPSGVCHARQRTGHPIQTPTPPLLLLANACLPPWDDSRTLTPPRLDSRHALSAQARHRHSLFYTKAHAPPFVRLASFFLVPLLLHNPFPFLLIPSASCFHSLACLLACPFWFRASHHPLRPLTPPLIRNTTQASRRCCANPSPTKRIIFDGRPRDAFPHSAYTARVIVCSQNALFAESHHRRLPPIVHQSLQITTTHLFVRQQLGSHLGPSV